jgi:hypothetical protein
MYRFPLTLLTRAGRLAALGILLTVPSVRAQSSCTEQVTSLISWLKSPPPQHETYRRLSAHVASNNPIGGIVTYASIPMKVATLSQREWLTAALPGDQYFSNVYSEHPSHPFAPSGIKTSTINVQQNGIVIVKSKNGTVTHTFTARCDQGFFGVMHGFPPATLYALPYYTISWVKEVLPTEPR